MLPDQHHHPLLWSRGEGERWLAGSPSLRVLADRWAQCEEDHLALSQREVQSLRVLADRWAQCEEDHLALSYSRCGC